jgi:beta-galactosidase
MAVADQLAVAREERDGVTLGFIPDYFMTECVHPGSGAMRAFAENLATSRFGGPGQALARAMLWAGFRFGCIDLQGAALDPATTPVLALGSARSMDGDLQARLVAYLERGGRLVLVGEVPLADMEGAPCLTLAERFGLRHLGERRSSPRYHLSLVAGGWAAPRAELRAGWAQVFEPPAEGVLLRVYGSDEACGFDLQVGDGRAILVTGEVPCDVALFRTAFARLGAVPALSHGCPDLGIFMTSSVTPGGERFVHLLNLDGFDKTVRLTDGGRELFPGRELILRRRDGLMLPFGVSVGPARIVHATAEIAGVGDAAITFRLTQPADAIALESDRPIAPSDDYVLAGEGTRWSVTPRRPAGIAADGDDFGTVRFA